MVGSSLAARTGVASLVAIAALALLGALIALEGAHATAGTRIIATHTTLSEDHLGEIIIVADGITLDCAGHRISGPGSGVGVQISGSGAGVRNCEIQQFDNAIVLESVSGVTIADNDLHDNFGDTVVVSTSQQNTLARNVLVGSGLASDDSTGILVRESSDNLFVDNDVSGHAAQQFRIEGGSSGNVLIGNVARGGTDGFALFSVVGTRLESNVAADAGSGFRIDPTSIGTTLIGNTALNGVVGFELAGSEHTVINNAAIGNRDGGFSLDFGASGNVLTGNQAVRNEAFGFAVEGGSDGNRLFGNQAEAGELGILVRASSDNTIRENTVLNNSGAGILVSESGMGNALLGNVVHSNGAGIVLGGCAAANDALDADAGANGCQNRPELGEVVAGSTTRLTGSLGSTPSREFRVEFFASGSSVPAGGGERLIGSTSVLTDAIGVAQIDVMLSVVFFSPTTITATATDVVTGDSSPFSEALSVPLRDAALVAGWNLSGWTGATPVRAATAALEQTLISIFSWDAATQAFRSFSPDAPSFINTLDELTIGDGLWLNVSQAVSWLQPPLTEAREVLLEAGFNLVMWTGPDDTAVADAVAMIAGNLEGLFLWDTAAQIFLIYRPTAPAFLNSAGTLRYGEGVWLRMTHAATWNQPVGREE